MQKPLAASFDEFTDLDKYCDLSLQHVTPFNENLVGVSLQNYYPNNTYRRLNRTYRHILKKNVLKIGILEKN